MSTPTPRKKFEDRLKALPARPGLYIFKNARGVVVYVEQSNERAVALYS